MACKKPHRIGSVIVGVGVGLLLLSLIQFSSPQPAFVKPVTGNILTGLGVWSSVYQSRGVVDPVLTANNFLSLKVNVTSPFTLIGFDIVVMWDPAVLAAVNVTERGGIFESGFQRQAREVAPDHVRLAGNLFGRSVPGNGTVLTFAVRIQALGSTTVRFNQTATTLARPSEVPYIATDGFFSNQPGDGDISLTSMSVNREMVTAGDDLIVTLLVRNVGAIPMTGVTATLYANSTVVNSTIIGLVSANDFLTTSLIWNTTGYSLGTYNLNATITTAAADSFTGDNSLALEQVVLVIHDLAATGLSAPSSGLVNSTVLVTVVLENRGTIEDVANVSITANTTLVRLAGSNRTSQTYTLSPGTSLTVVLPWNTTLLSVGRYSLTASVKALSGESNLADNVFVDGTITIKESFDHDLMITGSMPTQAVAGENLTLTFSVRNRGVFDEDYTLNVFLGSQRLFQDAGLIPSFANRTVAFVWNTRTSTPGTYPLKANVTSTATDENPTNNNVEVESFRLSANQPPVPMMGFNPVVTEPGTTASFNATSSFDPEGNLLQSYSWSFGDGSSNQTGAVVSHTYSSSGLFTVRLAVTDNFGSVSILTQEVRVNSPPVARFTPSQTTPEAGVSMSFDASSSTDGDGTVASYMWNFGDGTTGSGKTVSHAYSAAGNFQVVLTVTDNDGSSRTSELSVEVKPPSFPQLAIYLIVGASAAAIAAVLLIRSRRRKALAVSRSSPTKKSEAR